MRRDQTHTGYARFEGTSKSAFVGQCELTGLVGATGAGAPEAVVGGGDGTGVIGMSVLV